MTAPLSPEELAALRDVAESVEETSPLPWAVDEIAAEVYCADGDEVVATCFADLDAEHIAAAVNALPGLLATVAARDREIAALRERLALTEARTAVPPPRDALPGLRALAASEAAADVLRLAAPEVLP